jgi:hypothetical protein
MLVIKLAIRENSIHYMVPLVGEGYNRGDNQVTR